MDIMNNVFDMNQAGAPKANPNTVDQFVEEIKQQNIENKEEVKDEANLLANCDIYR